MNAIIQVCIVVVTIAVVLLVYFAARLLLRLEATTKKFEAGYVRLEEALEDSRQTSRRIRELVGVIEQIALTVQSGVEQVEGVVDRAASLGTAVLDEVERPVRRVVSIIRGLRSGVQALTGRWTNGRMPMTHSRKGERHV